MINGHDIERNQTLSIRECQSPLISTTNDKPKKTLITQTDGKINGNTSSETSPLGKNDEERKKKW